MLEEIDLFVCCCGQCDSVLWLWTVKHMVSAFALFFFKIRVTFRLLRPPVNYGTNFMAAEAAGKLFIRFKNIIFYFLAVFFTYRPLRRPQIYRRLKRPVN